MQTQELTAPRAVPRGSPRHLLAAGLVAGPLFTIVLAAQLLTRDGFDLGHHPISLLMLGDAGWIQVANYVLSGLLAVVFAVGVRRTIDPGRAATWGPILLALFGVGLIAGGLFVPDPALGFPPGTPDAIPTTWTWHSMLHAFAPPVGFGALVGACLVFARRFASRGQRTWAAYSVATAVVALALVAWPSTDGLSVRLAVGVVLGWAWVTTLAAELLAVVPNPATTQPHRG